jgi:hypothetical protein
MKLSKSLLQAIAVGIAVATTAPACTSQLKEELENEHRESCPAGCTEIHKNPEKHGNGIGDCPACGMG